METPSSTESARGILEFVNSSPTEEELEAMLHHLAKTGPSEGFRLVIEERSKDQK